VPETHLALKVTPASPRPAATFLAMVTLAAILLWL
jgi:hypothetical protein